MTHQERAIEILAKGGSILLPYQGPNDMNEVKFYRGSLVQYITQAIKDAVEEATQDSRGSLFCLVCGDHGNDKAKGFYCSTCGKSMTAIRNSK